MGRTRSSRLRSSTPQQAQQSRARRRTWTALALAQVSSPLGRKGADDVEVAELRFAVNDFTHAFGDPGGGGVLGVHHRLVVGRELHHLDVGAGVLAVSTDDVPSSGALGTDGGEPLI